jgi:hypothetical protein
LDNFKIIYKLLRLLEAAMDYEEFDKNAFSAERFKISEARWIRLLEMVAKNGYIEGFSIRRGNDGHIVKSESSPQITLKGLEYLQENSLMKKAANLAKGISDIIP